MNRAGDALALARPRRLGADVASAAETASKTSLIALLLRSFDVVVALAEALQIVWVDEHIPLSAVRDDVVDDRRRCAVPRITRRVLPRALPAERLSQELSRAQPLLPDVQHVPTVIPRARLALLTRFMPGAPALARQHTAPCMVARSQWFARHGLSPPSSDQNQKGRSQQHSARIALVIGSGSQSTGPLGCLSDVRFCSPGSRPKG